MNGVKWELFPSVSAAISATDEMIAKNRAQNPHIDGSLDEESAVCPELTSKFYYESFEGIVCPVLY